MDAPLRPPDLTETRINVRDLRTNLARYLAAAEAGARIAITSRGRVVARLGPPENIGTVERRRRALGALHGRIRVASDFDETPASLIDAMEAELPPATPGS